MSAGRYSALAAASIAILVITLTAAPLGAQTTIGLRAGIGSATLSGDGSAAPTGTTFEDSRSGVVLGIDAGIPLSGPLGVRIGMGLAQKGGAAGLPASITTGRLNTQSIAQMDYLQFSALLRASSDAEGGNLNFGILVGPYVGLNLSCNVALSTAQGRDTGPPVPPGIPNRVSAGQVGRTSVAQDTKLECGEDGTSEVTSSDFGLAFGGGFEVKLSDSMSLGFELIYAMGLSEIDDDGQKNRQVLFQSGLMFAIG
ncbi:porin family protein [Candidatus Palauibacter sp.]|uniref:porin family protein n=1 Tax=Candidatus Palauibacter sp. TaxID=3101350 RepID=UPI003B521468